MIKAIFFDIDGTLVSFQTHKVPQSARNAIKQLRRNGIKVFIATGRHRKSIPDFGDLEFDGYVTINGGLCMLADGKTVYKHPISPREVQMMVDVQHETLFPCLVMDEKGLFINFVNQDVDAAQELLLFPGMTIRPMEDSLKEDIFQMVSFISEEQEKELMSRFPGCHGLRWHKLFTDLVPKESHKGVGIDQMLAHFDITIDETLAFGDGGNDITMLEHVGLGVAMGNASDVVKSYADFVTDTVDNDGIEKALKYFKLI